VAGFSLHAGVAADAHQRQKLERLCRYITRPAVAIERLSLAPQGNMRYGLNTPYRDSTTHVIFEPLDFIARLASLILTPRVNLVRYHGVFDPHHQLRAQIVPAKRGRGRQQQGQGAEGACPRPVSMTWAQRLARAFAIDVTNCGRCGGAVKIIACVQAPLVIRKILDHVERAGPPQLKLPPARAPPAGSGLFD
jgi:Putative transposase